MDTACSHLPVWMRLVANNLVRPPWLSAIWVIRSSKRRQVGRFAWAVLSVALQHRSTAFRSGGGGVPKINHDSKVGTWA